jgi:nucleoside-diphosphate-sugar epimerase
VKDARILITGATSQVGLPVARALAASNEVFGMGRLRRAEERALLASVGVEPVSADLVTDDFATLPAKIDYVINFAVVKTGNFDHDLAANAEGVGRLMSRLTGVRAFLHCSSTAVYQADGHRAFKETDPLGDNHRAIFPTYSICKIAAESMVKFAARQWGIPTTIARLNVPYGDNGGWPAFHLEMMLGGMAIDVHADAPSLYNPIHEDDYIATIPRLLEVASIPATIVNWGGSEEASIEDWCRYIGALVGVEPKLHPTEKTIPSVRIDTTRMHELIGPTRVGWKEGIRRMVRARHPELELRG